MLLMIEKGMGGIHNTIFQHAKVNTYIKEYDSNNYRVFINLEIILFHSNYILLKIICMGQ